MKGQAKVIEVHGVGHVEGFFSVPSSQSPEGRQTEGHNRVLWIEDESGTNGVDSKRSSPPKFSASREAKHLDFVPLMCQDMSQAGGHLADASNPGRSQVRAKQSDSQEAPFTAEA